MTHPSNAALPSSVPTGSNSGPDSGQTPGQTPGQNPGQKPGPQTARGPMRRLLQWGIPLIVILIVGFVGYALIHPERMPESIGETVENLTGANAHPVQFMRPETAPLSLVASLGKELFNDPSLSASGKQSCASCHSAEHAYGPPNNLAVQLGGPHLADPGYRPPPSLTYLYRQAPFSIGPDASGDDVVVNLDQAASAAQGVQRAIKTAGAAPSAPAMVPQGGFFWDGRANTLQEQAIGPLTNPVEMANKDVNAVLEKLSTPNYRAKFEKIFGANIYKDPVLLASEAMFAIARYQGEDTSFHAFTSKYDYWLEGKARLTQAELRGLRLFNDKDKANCAGCHISTVTRDGLPPLFTDTQYEALGVPRNTSLAQNKDPKFYDMGVCGPFREDMQKQTQYCGFFLTPTLRNTATRQAFFHNGVYHDLRQVMDFYNLRNTNPDKIYPKDASGKVMAYNDLPAQYHENIDIADAPFDRKFGDKPAMSDQDIDDIIAFLKTLNDGYKVN